SRDAVEVLVERQALKVDLVIKERVHDDGGRARVLHPAYAVERARQRRSRRNHGVLQPQTYVACAQVHDLNDEVGTLNAELKTTVFQFIVQRSAFILSLLPSACTAASAR